MITSVPIIFIELVLPALYLASPELVAAPYLVFMEKPLTTDLDAETFIRIPIEVCENIIDTLYSYNSSDTLKDMATLQSCALVCRAWRIRSQKMLFYKVQLSDSPSFHKLVAILDTARHLYDYVHEVQLTGYHLHTTTSIFALFSAVFSRKLPNLERISVVHLLESSKIWYPWTSDPPKFKPLQYIPLHPHFPIFLSSFTAISSLYPEHTTFCSFTELGRMLHGFRNLEVLTCLSVRWITSGASDASANTTKLPADWAAETVVRRSFAPKLRDLRVRAPVMSNGVWSGVQRIYNS